MKTPNKVKPPKADHSKICLDSWNCPITGYITSCQAGQNVAVIPFPTAKAARAFCRVANMTEKERVLYLANAIAEPNGWSVTHLAVSPSSEAQWYITAAKSVLSALSLPHGEQRK